MGERGRIRDLDAYVRGKLLDHAGWQNGDSPLPRKVTPSDIDMVFDNDGLILFCEISSKHQEWERLGADPGGRGQVRLYQNIIRSTPHLAALCHHATSMDDLIDSRRNIKSFQVMIYDPHLPDLIATTDVFSGNGRWQGFVARWFADPREVRRFCLESVIQRNDH